MINFSMILRCISTEACILYKHTNQYWLDDGIRCPVYMHTLQEYLCKTELYPIILYKYRRLVACVNLD